MTEHSISLFFDEVLDTIDKYKNEIGEAQKLSETVYKYAKAKRDKSRSRMTLILKPFGSAIDLQKKCLDCCNNLNQLRKDIITCIKKAESVLSSKGVKCYRCSGMGTIQKPLYVREKGSTRQRTIRAIDCPECKGKGIIKVNVESEALTKQFIDCIYSLNLILLYSISCMRDLLKSLGGDNV